MSFSLLKNTSDGTIKGRAIHALSDRNDGTASFATLALGAAVADRETFTLGRSETVTTRTGGVVLNSPKSGDTYRILQVNTDTGANADAATATADTLVLKTSVSDIAVNDILRVVSEYLRVIRVESGTTYIVERGFAGSTAAAISNNANVYQKDGTVDSATDTSKHFDVRDLPIPVGSAVTAAAAETAITNAVNYWQTGYSPNYQDGGTGSSQVKASISGLVAQAFPGTGAGNVGVRFILPGGAGTLNGETFGDAANTLSDFGAETGPLSGTPRVSVVVEEDLNTSGSDVNRYAFPFDVTAVKVEVLNAGVLKTSNLPTVAVDGRIVTITENGTTAYVAADVLVVTAYG